MISWKLAVSDSMDAGKIHMTNREHLQALLLVGAFWFTLRLPLSFPVCILSAMNLFRAVLTQSAHAIHAGAGASASIPFLHLGRRFWNTHTASKQSMDVYALELLPILFLHGHLIHNTEARTPDPEFFHFLFPFRHACCGMAWLDVGGLIDYSPFSQS